MLYVGMSAIHSRHLQNPQQRERNRDNRKNKFQLSKKRDQVQVQDEDEASGADAGCAGFWLSSFKISRNIS